MNRRIFVFDIFGLGVFSIFKNKIKFIKNTEMARSVSTWKTSDANLKAGQLLDKGSNSLDAAVEGVAIEELNPKNTTVGLGGAPDRTGIVTLDACVMNHLGDCGSVVAVENIVHVARLAKDVMEKTPHVMLAGEGAEEFAYTQGYKSRDLLTKESKKEWKDWLKNQEYKPIINIPELTVEPSNARVGVKTGHGIFCSATFEKEVEVKEASTLIDSFNGVQYWEDVLPTPLDAEGKKDVLVGRMRKGLSDNRILNFWVVSDNLLKGAALNAVQIASYVVEND